MLQGNLQVPCRPYNWRSEWIIWTQWTDFLVTPGVFLICTGLFIVSSSRLLSDAVVVTNVQQWGSCLCEDQQRLAALLPPSFLPPMNPVLFVLVLSELYFHLVQEIELSCKVFSALRKKQQFLSCAALSACTVLWMPPCLLQAAGISKEPLTPWKRRNNKQHLELETWWLWHCCYLWG